MGNGGAVYLRDPRTRAGRWSLARVAALAGLVMMLAGAALTAVCVLTTRVSDRQPGSVGEK